MITDLHIQLQHTAGSVQDFPMPAEHMKFGEQAESRRESSDDDAIRVPLVENATDVAT